MNEQVKRFLAEPVDVAAMVGGWIKFLLFCGGLLYSYFTLRAQVNQIPTIEQQTTRIERYLSTKDPMYWDRIAVYGKEDR